VAIQICVLFDGGMQICKTGDKGLNILLFSESIMLQPGPKAPPVKISKFKLGGLQQCLPSFHSVLDCVRSVRDHAKRWNNKIHLEISQHFCSKKHLEIYGRIRKFCITFLKKKNPKRSVEGTGEPSAAMCAATLAAPGDNNGEGP
jgi:hypothetical protein